MPADAERDCTAAIGQAGIEVMVVTLSEQERAKIRGAQRRQYR